MKKRISCLLLEIIAIFYLFSVTTYAADRIVVIPLNGAIGDAIASDVIKGKVFSSKAGKGLTGTLEIRDGNRYFTNSVGMEFSLIPAGTFIMGSPDGSGDDEHRPIHPPEPFRAYHELQHYVTISRPFFMQTTEVTQRQWEFVMGTGTNPSSLTSCGMECPVESVSWNDAKAFINKLNEIENRNNCDINPNTCYSLPTESQWEYAARAGTVTALYTGDITDMIFCDNIDANLDEICWYCANSNDTTHPVAQKKPNAWGLYDMIGNVWEWCEDWYGIYPDGPVSDPSGGSTGEYKVERGGGWNSYPSSMRSASRWRYSPNFRDFRLGFRLVVPSGQ